MKEINCKLTNWTNETQQCRQIIQSSLCVHLLQHCVIFEIPTRVEYQSNDPCALTRHVLRTWQISQLILSDFDSLSPPSRVVDLRRLCDCVYRRSRALVARHHCKIETHPQRISISCGETENVKKKKKKPHPTTLWFLCLISQQILNPHPALKVGHMSASHNTDSRKVSRSAS